MCRTSVKRTKYIDRLMRTRSEQMGTKSLASKYFDTPSSEIKLLIDGDVQITSALYACITLYLARVHIVCPYTQPRAYIHTYLYILYICIHPWKKDEGTDGLAKLKQ